MSVHRVPESKGGGWEVRWRQHSRQRSKRFHDKDLADIFAADLRKRRRLGTLDDLDAGTELLSDWGRVWREKRAKVRLAASTLNRYEQVWDLWVLPYLGEYELREIDVGVADDYMADLHDAECGLETQRKALYLLQAVLGYAVRRRRIPYNPMLSFDKPRGRRRAVKPLPLTAIETMIASLPPRDSVLTELMAYQGLRPGEALALTDTSIRDRTLLVESNISLGEEKDTKTHRIRTVNFLRPVPQDLAAYRLGTRRDRVAGCPLLFPRPDGNPWRDTNYRNWRRRVFRPAAVAAGIATSTVKRLPDGSKRRRYNGPRPYDLRHTFVSLLIQEGRSIAYVAEQAGHTVEECARTYTHLFDEYRDARPVQAEDLIQRARARVAHGRAAL